MKYKKCTPDLTAYYSTLIASSCTRVFGGNPWKEHKICRICKKKFGLQDNSTDSDSNCKHDLEDFWKTGSLVEKVAEAFTHPCLSMWICEDEKTQDILGFTWGFVETSNDTCKILNNKGKNFLSQYSKNTKIGYQSAIGVLESYRENGIAKELYKKRRDDLCAMGAEIFIVRTSNASPMFSWLLKMGYKVIDDYSENQNDDRQILTAFVDNIVLV